MNILEIDNLSKKFGEHQVIDGLSLSVPERTVFGFLGPNGSGKTTTMKMVLGFLKPTSGSISICNERVTYGETKTNRHIGYLPDVPEFYNYMNPMEYLELCGQITGLSRVQIKDRSSTLLKLVGLDGVKKRIGSFSRGMKQRLGIGQALLNEPKLLICDEPTSALDPIGRKEILDILHSIKSRTTIVFSTHILSDVERICDQVAVLHKGGIVLEGTLSELKENRRSDKLIIDFITSSDAERFCSVGADISPMQICERSDSTVVIQSDNMAETQKCVFSACININLYPEKVEVQEPTLENLFMEVVK